MTLSQIYGNVIFFKNAFFFFFKQTYNSESPTYIFFNLK